MTTIRKVRLSWKRETVADPATPYNQQIRMSRGAAELARAILIDEITESFVVFLLTNKNHVLGYHEAGRGGIKAVEAVPCDVFRAAIAAGAACILVAHNHPSGDPLPSADDIALTKRLVEAGKLLGIPVLDHVIIAENGTFSFVDAGLLGG